MAQQERGVWEFIGAFGFCCSPDATSQGAPSPDASLPAASVRLCTACKSSSPPPEPSDASMLPHPSAAVFADTSASAGTSSAPVCMTHHNRPTPHHSASEAEAFVRRKSPERESGHVCQRANNKTRVQYFRDRSPRSTYNQRLLLIYQLAHPITSGAMLIFKR